MNISKQYIIFLVLNIYGSESERQVIVQKQPSLVLQKNVSYKEDLEPCDRIKHCLIDAVCEPATCCFCPCVICVVNLLKCFSEVCD